MNSHCETQFVIPDWPAPPIVRAFFTTRHGGTSAAPWNSFNLAGHVGDDPVAVGHNRTRLRDLTGLTTEPCWLEQVHGAIVHRVGNGHIGGAADAAITRAHGIACVVMVADCVPLLLCAADGAEVAALHAGWRGLAAGIIARTVGAFASGPGELHAWIGPCIGLEAYTVGLDLRERFVAADATSADCFVARDGVWRMDLRRLAGQQLDALGVRSVTVSTQCVYQQRDAYFSYRRDGDTGRMAALIWIDH